MILQGMGISSNKILRRHTHQQSQAIQIVWLENLNHSKSQSLYLESNRSQIYKLALLIKQNNLHHLKSLRNLLPNFEKRLATPIIKAIINLIKSRLNQIRIRLFCFFKIARNHYKARQRLP